jgi:hypothetical protein
MARRIIKFTAVFLLLLSVQCNPTGRQKTTFEAEHNRIDTADGMAQYLQKQNLPAVISIDAWPSIFGQGLKIATEHYDIYTTLFDPLILRLLPAFLESCYQAYQKLLPANIETKTAYAVYLFANRTQWEFYTLGYMGQQGPSYVRIKAGAYYLNGSCVAYNLGTDRTFRALGHECWHQFADRVFKFRLPSWLNEGLAMQFEAHNHKDGFFYFTPDRNHYRLVKLKQVLINQQLLSLETLVDSSPGEMIDDCSDAEVAAFYSQCYAMVRFLSEADGGRYSPNLKRILADGLSGKWPIKSEEKDIAGNKQIPLTIAWNRAVAKELFQYYVEASFEKIEQRYLDFCRKTTNTIHLQQIANDEQ